MANKLELQSNSLDYCQPNWREEKPAGSLQVAAKQVGTQ